MDHSYNAHGTPHRIRLAARKTVGTGDGWADFRDLDAEF